MVQRFDLMNVGCAERIWRQAETLAGRRHDVTLIQFPHWNRRKSIPPLRGETPPGVRIVNLDRRSASLPENCRILAALVQQCDLVHLWKAYPDAALPTLFALHRVSRPLHYDWDDLEGGPDGIAERLTASKPIGRLLARWEREILRWADTVTVSSQELRLSCIRRQYPSERIFPGPVGAAEPVLDPGLVKKWRSILKNQKGLIFIGQLEADDFPMELLAAVAAALKATPDAVFIVVGDGRLRNALQKTATDLGVNHRCIFTGYLSREETQAALSLSTLLLFPLRDDRMSRCKSPLVVVEAMSHGIPVVASPVGEVPRLLGDEGWTVPSLEMEAWRKALLEAFSMVERGTDAGRKLRERYARERTWDKAVDHLEDAYQCAMDSQRPSS